MAPENDDRLLSRIFDQLTAIERTDRKSVV